MLNFFNFFFKGPKVEHTDVHEDPTAKGPNIVWLHGANQTSMSFNYLKKILPEWPSTFVDYSSMNHFYDNLENIVDNVKDKGPLFVIGHSLGGIYAIHLLKHCNVVGGISISTPFRGSSMADWAKYIVPGYPLFRDVGRKSRPIVEAQEQIIDVPWPQIISTTGGVPYMGPNDGVVTIESMEYRKKDMECIYVPNTHYEVMCSDDVAHIIKHRYENVQKTYDQHM